MIFGVNFGVPGTFNKKLLKVTVAGEKCLRHVHVNDQLIICTCVARSKAPPPGFSQARGITVEVAKQTAQTETLMVASPPAKLRVLLASEGETQPQVRCPSVAEMAALLLTPSTKHLAYKIQVCPQPVRWRWKMTYEFVLFEARSSVICLFRVAFTFPATQSLRSAANDSFTT